MEMGWRWWVGEEGLMGMGLWGGDGMLVVGWWRWANG